MFITDEELKRRLESKINLNNILNPEEFEKAQAERDLNQVITGVIMNREERKETGIKGRVDGDKNVPQMFREIIAGQAQFGKASEIAKNYGVSVMEVNNLKNGIPYRKGGKDAPSNAGVQSVIEKVTGRIREKICDKIEMALDMITEGKMENEGARTLSNIAANLARTAQSLEDKSKVAIDNRVQTIIYTPETAQVSEYAELSVAR